MDEKDQDQDWTMPPWMEAFRPYFRHTGGVAIEELMNDEHTTAFNNAPRFSTLTAVLAQVRLLERLFALDVLNVYSAFYMMGYEARSEGEAQDACPVEVQGWRNAWRFGWSDKDQELATESERAEQHRQQSAT